MNTREHWDPTARTREFSLHMTEWQSETGTAGEREFGPRLARMLEALPCFSTCPENIRLLPSHDGTLNVVALLRGSGRRTLVFAGHYDTVPVANYRDLAGLATSPGALREALLADLRSRPLSPAEEKARADLEAGTFMPGRGLLDMKSGLAAGIAVLEHLAEEDRFDGNILFCATPDEERNSRGMRALREQLPDLAEEWQLDLIGAVNLDSISDQGDGEEGRAIYRGTIGKLLPFAYVIGQPSHASYPFEGVSAHLIAAELLRRIEANPALCDTGDGQVSPPPICLEGKDFRTGYDVTTPDTVWLAFNWLFHSLDAESLYSRFNALAREAMEWATATLNGHAESYAALIRTPPAVIDDGFFLTMRDLKDRAFAVGGPGAEARYATRAAELADAPNPLAASRELTALLVAEARLSGPAVVTGFAGLHYPPTRLSESDTAAVSFEAAIERARTATLDTDGVSIRYREIFTGISDMSFLGHLPAADAVEAVAANTAHPAMVDRPSDRSLTFPVVNIGPWGREYHQRLERVHCGYAWHDLPRFLARIARETLG